MAGRFGVVALLLVTLLVALAGVSADAADDRSTNVFAGPTWSVLFSFDSTISEAANPTSSHTQLQRLQLPESLELLATNITFSRL
jgi:hypothetical protein